LSVNHHRVWFCYPLSGLLTLWLAVGLNRGFGAESRATPRPNVVVILADDLGFSDVGCYGGEIATPNLDALANNGLRFTQFYNTGRCWPTRATILTGHYPQSVHRDIVPGIISGMRGVRPDWAVLLPRMLKPFGYRSYHAGKWHVDGLPVANGFDRSYYLEDCGRYFSPKVHYLDDQKLPVVERGQGYYATTAIADHTISFLKQHQTNSAAAPFFAYLCFTAPHFPLQALPADIAKYRDRYREGWDVLREQRWERMKKLGLINHALPPLEREVGPPYSFPKELLRFGPGETNRPVPWRELSQSQQEFQATKMAIHAAMIDRMDQEIGRVIEQLRAMQALDNTLILFLSDNGASAEMMVRDDGHDPKATPGSADTHLCLGPGWSSAANTPLRRHKTWVHEGGIATPLIAYWPGGIWARGELRSTPGHVIDVVPTILQLAGEFQAKQDSGASVPKPGRSLVSVFNQDEPANRREIWWSHEGNRALRLGDWKLVAAGSKAAWELYDLKADRGESRDLARANPELVRDLMARWEHQRMACLEAATNHPSRNVPPLTAHESAN
jgi:arylsulfatase A-like enzyme